MEGALLQLCCTGSPDLRLQNQARRVRQRLKSIGNIEKFKEEFAGTVWNYHVFAGYLTSNDVHIVLIYAHDSDKFYKERVPYSTYCFWRHLVSGKSDMCIRIGHNSAHRALLQIFSQPSDTDPFFSGEINSITDILEDGPWIKDEYH